MAVEAKSAFKGNNSFKKYENQISITLSLVYPYTLKNMNVKWTSPKLSTETKEFPLLAFQGAHIT